jgi:hypothetical protein
MSIKESLDEKLQQKAAEAAKHTVKPTVRDTDPELADALDKVAKGDLAKAYRTRNGALVVTQKSDPDNSPAAPAAPSA